MSMSEEFATVRRGIGTLLMKPQTEPVAILLEEALLKIELAEYIIEKERVDNITLGLVE